MPGPETSQLRTILTADLAGFSSRLSTDEAAIIRLLVDSYYRLAERAVDSNGGELFRKEGDAVWCSFSSARGAVQAAIELQMGALTHNRGRGADNPMHLRVGVHLGEVVVTPDGEILGHTLSVAKRLETACEVDAVHLSESVYAQLAGLDLAFDFEDQGVIDLKGVGPIRTFLGRPKHRTTAPEPGGHLVLAALLDTLEPTRRTEWERAMLALATRLAGWWKVAENEVGFLVLPASAWLELAAYLEWAPRCGLALGPAMVLEQELYGAAVEEALSALESGFQPDLVVMSGEAAELAWPPSGHFRRTSCISAFDGQSLLDLAQGGPPLAAEASRLTAELELELPSRTLFLGGFEPPRSGQVEGLRQALAASPLQPRELVGHPGWGPSVTAVTSPEELKTWLVGRHRADHLAVLSEALANQTLSLVCAALAGGEGPALAEALDQWSGLALEGSLPARLEEAEDELGRQALEVGLRDWLTQLPPGRLEGLVGRVPRERVICLFPDPRLGECEWTLTESDWDERGAELIRLNREQQQRLAAQPLLLVASAGFEEPLRVFYRQLRLRCPATPQQLTVLALEEVSPGLANWWERRQVKVLVEDFAELERRLLEAAPRPSGEIPRRRARSPERPYKFLDYFDPEDRSIFFGRESETEQLYSLLLTRPVCLLHGRSGVGKTSLLQAGVLARLPRPQNLVLVVRCLTEPVRLILSELEPLVGARTSLLEAFEAAVEVISGQLVIVLDQFEEFFVRLDRQSRTPFFEQMASLVTRMPGRCHLVFSMREDFLAEMADFEPYFPTILDHRFRLRSLGEEQARRAIIGPAELFGLEVEPALVERLLSELFRQGVEPPELQIVLDRLYETRQGSRLDLEAYDRLGGVRSILVDYLHTTLSNLAAEGVELPFVRRLLEQMVTERGTKAVMRIEELVERLGQPLELVQQTLLSLVASRLVRALADDQGGQYELAHEYIIAEVIGWASQEELAVRHARQVLRAELESWQTMGSLLSAERLNLIARERSRLDFSPEERDLVVRAAAIHGFELGQWTDQRDREVLASLLTEGHPSGPVARALVARLYELDPGDRLSQVIALACRRFGNPNLMDQLDPGRSPALHQTLQAATRERFFGPEKMVRVAAGDFLMGSTSANKEARKQALRPDQRPAIESESELAPVWLAEFHLDRHPVTNAEFAEFRAEHAHRFRPEHADHPAVFVSWFDAVAYAEWLGKRLPSEAEWEKAARGDDGRLFPWGDRFEAHRVNSAEGGRQATSAVGSFPNGASPFGCQDMVGNVWEWTASAWKEGAPFKTQKGGSTVCYQAQLHCSTRLESFPDFIQQWVGFRTAWDGGAP